MRLGQLSEGIVDDWSKLSADAKRAVLKKDAAFPEEQLDFAFVEAAIKFRELSQNALDTGDYSKTAFGLLNESGISIDALYANGLLQKKQVGDYVVEEGHAT
ncbi:MAG: hypothetical protein J0L97_05205, partial [Alphaproteobacteria bacterium]|nr:hypothetical protein [Alphaproteobacteria bacterium]